MLDFSSARIANRASAIDEVLRHEMDPPIGNSRALNLNMRPQVAKVQADTSACTANRASAIDEGHRRGSSTKIGMGTFQVSIPILVETAGLEPATSRM